MKAIWNGAVVAESDDTVVIEGNHYFPEGSLRRQFFEASTTTTFCGWKGRAQYYTLCVAGRRNQDACWYYARPEPAARQIRDRVAFWKGVQVVP